MPPWALIVSGILALVSVLTTTEVGIILTYNEHEFRLKW